MSSAAVGSHSGAGPLSLMSCVRESSPLQDFDSYGERNVTSKRRFWNPRRWFRRKHKPAEDVAAAAVAAAVAVEVTGDVTGAKDPAALRSRSTSELSIAEQGRRRSSSSMQPGLSVSHDSVFHSPNSQSDMDLFEGAQSSSSLSISHPLVDQRLQTELSERLRLRRGGGGGGGGDASEDDEGLPHSPTNSPTTSDGLLRNKTANKDLPTKSHSTCSDGSLLSMGSYEDEDSFYPATLRHSSKKSLREKRPSSESELDFGARSTVAPLNHSAAHHRRSVMPKRTHGAPQRKKQQVLLPSALPATPEVNEDSSIKSISPEGSRKAALTQLYAVSPPPRAFAFAETGLKCSSLPPGLAPPPAPAKLNRSKSNAGEPQPQPQPQPQPDKPSLFERIFPRKSAKKKQKAAPAEPTGAPRASGPAARQRVVPIELPEEPKRPESDAEASPALGTSPIRSELESRFKSRQLGKVTPPGSPTRPAVSSCKSRSPERSTVSSMLPFDQISSRNEALRSKTRMPGLSALQRKVMALNDDEADDAGFKSLIDFKEDSARLSIRKSHSFRTGKDFVGKFDESKSEKGNDDKSVSVVKAASLDSVEQLEEKMHRSDLKLELKISKNEAKSIRNSVKLFDEDKNDVNLFRDEKSNVKLFHEEKFNTKLVQSNVKTIHEENSVKLFHEEKSNVKILHEEKTNVKVFREQNTDLKTLQKEKNDNKLIEIDNKLFQMNRKSLGTQNEELLSLNKEKLLIEKLFQSDKSDKMFEANKKILELNNPFKEDQKPSENNNKPFQDKNNPESEIKDEIVTFESFDSVTVSGPSHTSVVNVSGTKKQQFRSEERSQVSVTKIQLKKEAENRIPEFLNKQLNKVELQTGSNVVLSMKSPSSSSSTQFEFDKPKAKHQRPKTTLVFNAEQELIACDIDPNFKPSNARKFSKENLEIVEKKDEEESSKDLNDSKEKTSEQVFVPISVNVQPSPTRFRKNERYLPATRKSSVIPIFQEQNAIKINNQRRSFSLDSLKSEKSSTENDSEFEKFSSRESLDNKLESSSKDEAVNSLSATETETTVVLRRKSVASHVNNKKNNGTDEPELMKVFARRSLKLKDNDVDFQSLQETLKSTDSSDKENNLSGSDRSPLEERKKGMNKAKETMSEINFQNNKANNGNKNVTETSVETNKEFTMKKDSPVALRRTANNNLFVGQRAISLKNDFTVSERRKTEQWVKSSTKIEVGEVKQERTIEEKIANDFITEPKNFNQRKAEWEKRAQLAQKKTP